MDNVKSLPRKARAARTRAAIIRAATEEFRSSGYHGTTMAAIAKRARVAVQTVYFVFHTKPALLTAAFDSAVMGEDDPAAPEETSWWQEGTTTTDGPKAIELFVTNVAEISTRAAVLDRVALAAATTDPEIVDLIARHESLRTQGFRTYIDTLAARGLLQDELDPSEATDVLLTLAGADVFLNFTEGRGWTLQRYVRWTTEALWGLLLRSPAGGPIHPGKTSDASTPKSCRP
ncbi:MAG: TetR/AcrR family transcriptional regulator [Actinomycetota bacterium]|nr:TetR/AcrR family transcriptional regulator [Actinomycetota bacterium]